MTFPNWRGKQRLAEQGGVKGPSAGQELLEVRCVLDIAHVRIDVVLCLNKCGAPVYARPVSTKPFAGRSIRQGTKSDQA